MCAACTLLLCTCKPRGSMEQGQSARVMLLDAIPNDLAQVMLLTRDTRGNNDQFIKEFYRAQESPADTRNRMINYMKSIKKYRGTLIVIRYTINTAGNKTVISINPATR